MKGIIKISTFSLVAGYFVFQLQTYLESCSFSDFLKKNLITLLVTLLAINSATLGIVLTKIRDLLDSSKKLESFTKTKKEMILSINEQIALIIISSFVIILCGSKYVQDNGIVQNSLTITIIACFIYSISIVHDTAMSVFTMLDFDAIREP